MRVCPCVCVGVSVSVCLYLYLYVLSIYLSVYVSVCPASSAIIVFIKPRRHHLSHAMFERHAPILLVTRRYAFLFQKSLLVCRQKGEFFHYLYHINLRDFHVCMNV